MYKHQLSFNMLMFISILKFLVQELYGDCDKLRQTVSQLATETEDNDGNLGNKSCDSILLIMVTCSGCPDLTLKGFE